MRGVAALGGYALLAVVSLVAALIIGLIACGGPSPTGPTSTPAEPTPVPTPVPTASGAARRAVRIEGFDPATLVLRFTDAQIFFNEEADRAAREDGHPGGAPNPVWIRDLFTTGALPIAPDARITLLGFDAFGQRIPKAATVATLAIVIAGAAPPGTWDQPPTYLFITAEEDSITEVEQPALP